MCRVLMVAPTLGPQVGEGVQGGAGIRIGNKAGGGFGADASLVVDENGAADQVRPDL